jgi:ketosteroid isomerase-like protein
MGQHEGMKGVVERLRLAVDSHDAEAVTACFAADYVNETPLHPERGFRGQEQVRRNWQQIFAFVPDVRAQVLRCAVDEEADTVWSEWEHRGTRLDGTAHVMRGVVIFGVVEGLLAWARFYLEPVEAGDDGVDAAVRRQVMSAEAPSGAVTRSAP